MQMTHAQVSTREHNMQSFLNPKNAEICIVIETETVSYLMLKL